LERPKISWKGLKSLGKEMQIGSGVLESGISGMHFKPMELEKKEKLVQDLKKP